MESLLERIPIYIAYSKRVVFIILILSCFFLLSSLVFRPSLPRPSSQDTGELTSLTATEERTTDCTGTITKLQKRQLFAPLYRRRSVSNGINPEKIIGGYRLVGIISVQPVQAVIDDKKRNKTYYVKEGESITPNITVEKIKKDSAVINCYGEEFELYL